jgi:hypothetical protein
LTGWAQICGGKLISTAEKNALDEWYIRHASLGLDAVIVLRTVRMLLTNDRRAEEAIATALLEQSLVPRSATARPAPVSCAAPDSPAVEITPEPVAPADSEAIERAKL